MLPSSFHQRKMVLKEQLEVKSVAMMKLLYYCKMCAFYVKMSCRYAFRLILFIIFGESFLSGVEFSIGMFYMPN